MTSKSNQQNDTETLSVKARPIRKGFVWLVKPTIWRNRWNLDEAVAPSAPTGMRVQDLTETYKRLKKNGEHEAILEAEVLEKLETLSDTAAYEYYVEIEELSDAYQEHRRHSLRIKGWISYFLSFFMLSIAFMLGSELSLSVLVGKGFVFLFFVLLLGQGFTSFYRAEQIRQRRMFHFLEMFEHPVRFIY